MELPFNIHVNFFFLQIECIHVFSESVFHLKTDDGTALHFHTPVILEFLK